MSALAAGEATSFPYQTRNLTPPTPFDEVPQNIFDERKLAAEQQRREADIAKAMAQEAMRWAENTPVPVTQPYEMSQYAAQLTLVPDGIE